MSNAIINDFKLINILKGDDNGRTAIFLFIPIIIIAILNSFNTTYIITDYPGYLNHLNAFQFNPYDSSFYSKYPAFYFIFMGILGFLGVNTIFELKLIFGLIDVINVALLIKMAKLISPKSKKMHYFIGLIYFYFPIHLYFLKMGENDVVSIMLFLLAINFFLEKLYGRSAIFLGFAIMFKIFPIFFLLPITVYFLNQKQIRNLILYWMLIGVVFLVLSAPYLINDLQSNSTDYFQGIFIHTNRMSTGNSYAPAVSFFYQSVFQIGFIDISVVFLIQISCLAFLFLFFLKKYHKPTNPALIIMTFYTLFIMFIFMFQDNHTNFTRYLPLLLIILFCNLNELNLNDKFAILIVFYSIFLFLFQIILIYVVNDYNLFYTAYKLYYIIFTFLLWKMVGKEHNEIVFIFIFMFISYEFAQIVDYYLCFNPTPIVRTIFFIRTLYLLPMILALIKRPISVFSNRFSSTLVV